MTSLERKEASTTLIGVGGLLVLASSFNGFAVSVVGQPFWAGWAFYGIGPGMTGLGMLLLFFGVRLRQAPPADEEK